MTSRSLDLPERIPTMNPFPNRVERTNLCKGGEVGARKRRYSTRELFDGSEGALGSCSLKFYGGVLSKPTGKAKAKTERERTVVFALQRTRPTRPHHVDGPHAESVTLRVLDEDGGGVEAHWLVVEDRGGEGSR